MRKRLLVVVLLVLSLSVVIIGCGTSSSDSNDTNNEEKQIATLRSVSSTLPEADYFDFSEGKVITLNTETDNSITKDMFFVYESPNNYYILGEDADGGDFENFLLLTEFTNLDEVSVVPDTGYVDYSDVDILLTAGDIFAVKTPEGNYAKIQIISVDSVSLKFEWEYQPNGSRNFP